ncbi:hypothetical protein M432DRAFT_621592 [Thermoascus aurantiacus ATCC 26904]
MASGIAFHWDNPSRIMLNLDEVRNYTQRQTFSSQTVSASRMRRKISRTPSSTGTLGRLPVEILHEILLSLDLCTLGAVRRLHSFYCRLVGGLPEYKLLTKHAHEALRIMHLTKTLSYFSIRRIFAEFCHPRCRTCDDFGTYLFLLTCRRCCLNCLNSGRREYQLAQVRYIAHHYALTGDSMKELKTLSTFPHLSRFHNRNLDWKPRLLASQQAAFELGVKIHGSEQAMWDAAKEIYHSLSNQYYKARAAGEEENSLSAALSLAVDSYFGGYDIERWRYMGSTAFPFWDRRRRVLETGTYCGACAFDCEQNVQHGGKLVEEQRERYNRAFLLSEIPSHFLSCEALKRGYEFGQRYPYRKFKHGEDFWVSADGRRIEVSDLESS